MEQEKEEKLRGLFVIRVDKRFDATHPLWDTIHSYREILEEAHVLIFSKAHVEKKDMLTEPEPGLFFYRCSSRFALISFIRRWKFLAFQLYWRKTFRAHFILSFTLRSGGLFAYILSRRFKRPFFVIGSMHDISGGPFSLRRKLARFLMRRAVSVIAPGSQNALSLSKTLDIPPAQFTPLQPPVDKVSIGHNTEKYDFNHDHIQYNFFSASTANSIDALRSLMLVHARVVSHYPRVGLVVFADERVFRRLSRFIKRTKSYGVFVYHETDALLSQIAGTHVYLGISRDEEVDMSLVMALGLGVPVVAYRSGIAGELFPDTPYARFACDPGDAETASRLIVELLEHQAVRAEYALNTSLVFDKFSFRDTDAYVRNIHDMIESIVRPPKQGTSAGVMYLHNLQVEEEEHLKSDKNAIG